ncbi:MAG: aldo/keto reductase [Chloroflexi bacterium]|nr:aldo/keto reductase [Chloroflexota bacterium]
MEYRHLGKAGVKVSILSFGSWVTFHFQAGVDKAVELMSAAYEAGVNFFDNAEEYADGKSEEVMGAALKKLGWRRSSYLVSTKLFWGRFDNVNEKDTLNRKYLSEAIDGSLQRLDLDHVDILFCHRPDPQTPIEETVYAMHRIVESGKAIYWGTSEWSAMEIVAAIEIAERHHLHKPVTEQPRYNLLKRDRFEKEYARLFKDYGFGTTTWSPLHRGVLTGKYLEGIPEGSRGALPEFEWLHSRLTEAEDMNKVRKLQVVADDLGVSLANLSIAWCIKNPNVSTAIMGASKLEQLQQNLKSLDVVPLLTDDVMSRIDEITK